MTNEIAATHGRPLVTDWRAFAEAMLADLDAFATEVEQMSYGVKEKPTDKDGDETIVVDAVELDMALDDLITDIRRRMWVAQIEDDRRPS